MGEGNTCEVCGGTEMKLVDGYYYCVECGTQDTNVQERVVEHTLLAIGNYALSDRRKFTVKTKEGVDMSPEWYKWHTYNFILAGLTERLVQLGAEPGFKMKALWIWARYMSQYLNKEEFGRTQEVHKIGDKSESEGDEPAHEGQREGERVMNRYSVCRMSKLVLLTMLAAALNLQRSAVTLARLRRLVRHGLLPLNTLRLLVPRAIDTRKVEGFWKVANNPHRGGWLPYALGRLQRALRLGPWRAPAVEAVLAALLRDLRLPAGLARLVRALMWLAPVPFAAHRPYRAAAAAAAAGFPEYETTMAAYVLLALKLCFGLDDRHERRLSDAAERVNNAENRRRLYVGDGDGDGDGDGRRLFSYRQWMRHVRFQRHVLADACAPVAHERNERAQPYAVMEQSDELTPRWDRRGGRGEAVQLSDRVSMDVLERIPLAPPAALPGRALRPALAAAAPLAAVAAALEPHLPPRARTLITEDFTRYSVDYAYRTLALPSETGENLVVGVSDEGKSFVDRLGDEFARKYDPDVVYVRNCENENWARTRRPRPFHVVEREEPPASEPSDADDGHDAPAVELETFEEEADGRNIFDDDFLDAEIKEEKDSILDEYDTKDNLTLYDLDHRGNFSTEHPASVAPDCPESVVGDGGDGERRGSDSDSDEERAPRYDAATFDRAETIKAIMAAAYDDLKIRQPARFRVRFRKYYRRTKRDLAPGEPPPREKPRDWERKLARDERAERVREILAAYRDNLQRDVLHQVAEQVRAAIDRHLDDERAPSEPAVEPAVEPDVERNRDRADTVEVSSAGSPHEDARDNTRVDKSEEESDGPAAAEDPAYEGDARYDAATHDATQLYIKFTAPPPPPPPADDRERGADDDDVAALLSAACARPTAPEAAARPRRPARERAPRFPPLVADPDGVSSFGCWFKHYDLGFRSLEDWTRALELEVDAAFPRSFRFALREAAAALRVSPATVYSRLMDAEAALLRRLGQRPPGNKWRPWRAQNTGRRRTRRDRSEDPDADVSRGSAVPGAAAPAPAARGSKRSAPTDARAPRRLRRRTGPAPCAAAAAAVPEDEEPNDPGSDMS